MKTNTILAIDDDQPMLRLLKQVLRDQNVVCFSSAIDAMMWLSEGHEVDLVILDKEMPGLSGKQFLRGLRGSGIHRELPVMMLSGWLDQEFKLEAKKLKVDALMEKPFDPTALSNSVNNLLERQAVA